MRCLAMTMQYPVAAPFRDHAFRDAFFHTWDVAIAKENAKTAALQARFDQWAAVWDDMRRVEEYNKQAKEEDRLPEPDWGQYRTEEFRQTIEAFAKDVLSPLGSDQPVNM